MSLDLRTPIGLMFTLVGAILTAFGLSTSDKLGFYDKSQGINVNLWWGVVLLAFGLTMFVFGQRGQKQLESGPLEPVKKSRRRR
jgi:hypothetical protein